MNIDNMEIHSNNGLQYILIDDLDNLHRVLLWTWMEWNGVRLIPDSPEPWLRATDWFSFLSWLVKVLDDKKPEASCRADIFLDAESRN